MDENERLMMEHPVGMKHFKRVPKEHWNSFVKKSDSAWVFHLWEWQDLMSNSWKGKNLSFAVGENKKMVGVFPAFQMDGNPGLIDSGFGHGGFAYQGEFAKIKILRIIAAGIRNLYMNVFNESASDKWLRIVLPPFEGFENDYQEYIHAGFADCSTICRVIDLSQDEDSIFAGFSATTRNNIRNAEKSGITCKKIDTGEASAKDYYKLHESTYARNGLSPHPFEYFLSLHTIMKDYYMCMAAYDQEGTVLNMANFALYKSMSFYGTAASIENSKATNAAKLLQWEAMREMKQKGITQYAIGDIFPDSKPEDGKLYGLTRFKSSFGGKIINARKAIIKIGGLLG